MKKFVATVATAIAISILVLTLTGCTEAEKVSYNLSQEADNFNDIRQITVINCLQGEDITAGDVEKYKYTLNFNPKMWLPVEIDTID